MRIIDYLNKNCIKVYLNGDSRDEITREMVELLHSQNPEINVKEALHGLSEREKLGTTSIGKGVAIPHARLNVCDDITACFGLLKKGIDLDAIDGEPVNIVFLILYPNNKIGMQLRFLARVARLLQHKDLRDNLCGCKNADEVFETFKNFENAHFH